MKDGQMLCFEQGCEHFCFKDFTVCACHLEVTTFKAMPNEVQVEAIRFAALENERFEVDGDGDIRLKEER